MKRNRMPFSDGVEPFIRYQSPYRRNIFLNYKTLLYPSRKRPRESFPPEAAKTMVFEGNRVKGLGGIFLLDEYDL